MTHMLILFVKHMVNQTVWFDFVYSAGAGRDCSC